MAVITMNGQVGAGGRELASAVAQALGLHYIDQQLLIEAAQRLGAAVEVVARRDERVSSVGERITRFLQNFLEKSAAAGATGDPFLGPSGIEILVSRSYHDAIQPPTSKMDELDDARFLAVTKGIIQDLAQAGNVIIIGRGGNIILRDFPGALHIGCVGSFPIRVERIMRRERCNLAMAEQITKEREADRVTFFRKFFKVDTNDPSLYHVVFNMDKVPLNLAVSVLCSMAKEMEVIKQRQHN